jgi:hypothetical protein
MCANDASEVLADVRKRRRVDAGEAIDWTDPALDTRPVREYLAALDRAADSGQVPTKQISLTDPSAHWTAARGGLPVFAYSGNCLIDLEAGIVVDTEATTALRTEEIRVAQEMIDRVEARHAITPHRLAADTAYGSGPTLSWLVEEKGIEPHIPVWDRTDGKPETFGWSAFRWDEAGDCYHCPAGHAMTARGQVTVDNTIIYRASKFDCDVCPLKPRCCPNTPARRIARSVHEDARDYTRQLAQTEAYAQSRNDRKKVEIVFAHMKRIIGLRRFRLRGMTGARDELLLAATALNLRKLAKLIWRPPITGAVCPG